MRETIGVVGVYIATIIGAGFASGSEVVSYFVRYGRISIWGVFLSAVCFGLLATMIIKRVQASRIEGFRGYLEHILPNPLVDVVEGLIVLFMAVVFIAMLAGAGEAIGDFCGLPKQVGVLLLLAICLAVFCFDLRGLMAANGAMSVLIITGILGVCWYVMHFREMTVFADGAPLWDNWAVSGASYVSYNILTASAILVEMGSKMREKRGGWVGVCSGVVLFLLLGCLWCVIRTYYGKISLGSIPMLTICKRMGNGVSLLYTMILFVAMLTTALSNGFAVVEHVSRYINRKLAIGIVLGVGYCCAGLDFAVFIDVFYRILGYLGFGLVGFIFGDAIKLKK